MSSDVPQQREQPVEFEEKALTCLAGRKSIRPVARDQGSKSNSHCVFTIYAFLCQTKSRRWWHGGHLCHAGKSNRDGRVFRTQAR